MKKFFAGPFIAILIVSLTPSFSQAVDWDSLREFVEGWISAAGTQVPDPVGSFASMISAVPAATQAALLQKCQQNMQTAILELDDPKITEKRIQELHFILDKNQAVKDALSGKPENLRKIISDLKAGIYRPADKPPGFDITAEEKENMAGLLSRYEKKIADIGTKAFAAWEAYRKALKTLASETGLLDQLFTWIVGNVDSYGRLKARADILCEVIRQTSEKSKAYAVLVIDHETPCREKLKNASDRAAVCKTKEDKEFIRAQFEDAKKIAAQMEKDLTEAETQLNLWDQSLTEWKAIPDRMKNAPGKQELNRKQTELTQRESSVQQNLVTVFRSAGEIKGIVSEANTLEADILSSEQYYTKLYPESKDRFQALIRELKKDITLNVPDFDGADEVTGAQASLQKVPWHLSYFKILNNMEISPCPSDDQTRDIFLNALAARDEALLELAAHEGLVDSAGNCGQTPPPPPPPVAGSSSAPPQPPSPLTPVQLLPGLTSPGSGAGGLFIQGPAVLLSGDGAAYQAVDGAGMIYSAGITWNSSVEDVVIMDHATGSAKGFKAGKSTLIAHREYPGTQYPSTAFFDVTVLARVPNLKGMTGPEALGLISEKGLTGTVHNPMPQGKVITQTPAPGTVISSDTMISITLAEDSSGQDRNTPPEAFSFHYDRREQPSGPESF